MCTDCNCGNKRAIPWGAIGRRWAQSGRKQKLAGWGGKAACSGERAGAEQGRSGRQGSRECIVLRLTPKRNQAYRGLKPSPCSTVDPELIWISVNAVAGAGELRANSSQSATRWQWTSETQIRGERQWVIKNKWGVKGVTQKRRNENIVSIKQALPYFVFT